MYPKIAFWVQNYGSGDRPDQRAVQDFMDCEAQESLNSLRNELASLAQGSAADESVLDQLIGVKRKLRHDSFQAWAKMMLMWMASYKT